MLDLSTQTFLDGLRPPSLLSPSKRNKAMWVDRCAEWIIKCLLDGQTNRPTNNSTCNRSTVAHTKSLPQQFIFLAANTQLYKRLCPSVPPSIHGNKLKSEMSIRDGFRVGRGGGGSVGCGGWTPLPTHPQRYRNPASLVFNKIDPAEIAFLHFRGISTDGSADRQSL